MDIIVAPADTPLGLGVAQVGEKFFPVSGCCFARLFRSRGVAFHCADCGTVLMVYSSARRSLVPTSLSLDGMVGEEYAASLMLKDCISQWTGWPEEQINVKVENP